MPGGAQPTPSPPEEVREPVAPAEGVETIPPQTPKIPIREVASPSLPPNSPPSLGVMGGERQQVMAASGAGGTKRQFVEDDFEVMSSPPPVLTARAVYNRLRRVFQKRADGSNLLDDRWNEAWNDAKGSGRQELYSMSEKVGYNVDRVYVEKISKQCCLHFF